MAAWGAGATAPHSEGGTSGENRNIFNSCHIKPALSPFLHFPSRTQTDGAFGPRSFCQEKKKTFAGLFI